MAFPSALNTFSDAPAAPTTSKLGLTTPRHSEYHQEITDALREHEAAIGVTGSTDTASIEYRLSSVIAAAGDAADAAAAAAIDAAVADAKGAAAALGLYDLIADLGTAAYLNAGAGVGNLVQLAVAGQLPALDGSLLTGLAPGGVTDYADLTGKPTLGTAAATAATDYAVAAKGVTNGDSHDHNGGDGAQIAYGSLSGTPTLGTAAAAATGDFEPSGAISTHNAVTTAHGISAFGATLVDDADAATARTTLGLGTAATTASTAYATSTQGSSADAHIAASAPHSGHSTPASVATLISTHNSDGAAHPSLVPTTTTIGTLINGATSKTTPVDADQIGLMDSAASNVLKKLSWANIKTALQSVFVTLAGKAGGQTIIGGSGAGEALTLQATSNATPGDVRISLGGLMRSVTTREYVQSRQQSLITNGSGLMLDNTNFSTFTYDAIDVKSGVGSFRVNANTSSRFSDELIPVDVENRYALSLFAKSGDVGGANYNAANRQYFGISMYDIDGLNITTQNGVRVSGAVDTTLAAALNPGDTTVTLASASGWSNGPAVLQNNFCWYGYTNSFGYTYPDYEYTRLASNNYSGNNSSGAWVSGGISGNVITLRVPWAGPSLPAGTKVRNNFAGGTYQYIAGTNIIVPNAWTKYSGSIGAPQQDYTEVSGSFRRGTAYIKLLFLINYHGAADNNLRLSGLNLTQLSSANLEPNIGVGATYKSLPQYSLPTNGLAVEGYAGFGTNSASAPVHVIGQFRNGYDAANYQYAVVSSGGIPTWTSTGGAFVFQGDIRLDKTITAGGTTGARTINNTLGSVNFAAGASSLVVTNSRVTTSSIIIATVATADATMKSVVAVAAAGSFTLTANAAATAETRVNFTVLN